MFLIIKKNNMIYFNITSNLNSIAKNFCRANLLSTICITLIVTINLTYKISKNFIE
jgi:hypothetical protein